MTPEQYTKLQALSEKLAVVAFVDAEPENWVGYGRLPKDLTQQERGDAYWCRKMALSTLSVLHRVVNLSTQISEQNGAGKNPALENEQTGLLEAEIAAAEKEAGHLLDKLHQRKAKAKFDQKLNVKP